ncbi:MAG TPA: DUF6127 family protein [Alphaproteobacteria bacterium]|nr:DUF6127 family protein [Alphaproteobacteria bacterium]
MTEPSLETLARRSAKAAAEGLSEDTLRQLVDAASELGASRALARCGLQDANAGADIAELRTLLDAWRDTKLTARRTAVRWLIRAVLTALAITLAVKLKLLAVGHAFGI